MSDHISLLPGPWRSCSLKRYIFIRVRSEPISGFPMSKGTFSALYILPLVWGNYPLFRRFEGIIAIYIIIFLMPFFRIFRGFIQFTQSIQALILRVFARHSRVPVYGDESLRSNIIWDTYILLCYWVPRFWFHTAADAP